jgi:hypothetical protein
MGYVFFIHEKENVIKCEQRECKYEKDNDDFNSDIHA